MRLLLVLALICAPIALSAQATAPTVPDAHAASVLVLKQRIAELEREAAQLKFLLGVYQNAVHGQLVAPFDKTLADLAAQRVAFERAHPAPAGYRLDWTTTPPSYVKESK